MFGFLKKLFGGSKYDALGLPPAWLFRYTEPNSKAYPLPQCVDYELDLSTWQYRIKETFCNDDPYAESEISYVRMEYEVRRSAAGQWEIRLLAHPPEGYARFELLRQRRMDEKVWTCHSSKEISEAIL